MEAARSARSYTVDEIRPLLSRVKVLANLNIAERRRPQDGQLSMQVDGREVDFRVATINTIHGERVVLRVLERVQRAGGRVVSVADWLRGAALPEGARLERLGGLDAAAG